MFSFLIGVAMSSVFKSLPYTCKNYSEFYAGESAFRNLCAGLTEIDFSALDGEDSISPEEKEFLKEQVTELLPSTYNRRFPMNIYSDVDGAPGLSLIYVACDGLPVGKLPSIDDVHGQWLAQQIASGWQNDGCPEQMIIAAYALADDGESPKQVVFMRRGIANPPTPANDLQFSKCFHPNPPWNYDGVNSALYEGVAYAKQIAAIGSAGFLKFHMTASIEMVIENIITLAKSNIGANLKSTCDKHVPNLHCLRDKVEAISDAASRDEVSVMFNSLTSDMDSIIEDMIKNLKESLHAAEQQLANAKATMASVSTNSGGMADATTILCMDNHEGMGHWQGSQKQAA